MRKKVAGTWSQHRNPVQLLRDKGWLRMKSGLPAGELPRHLYYSFGSADTIKIACSRLFESYPGGCSIHIIASHSLFEFE